MPDVAARDAELRSEGLFAAEGRLLVSRAAEAGLEIVRLFADSAAAGEARALFPRAKILDAGGLSAEAGYNFHRGMLAHVRRPPVPDAAELPAPAGLALALPKITDPGNLGTLLRSALAFGFRTALLGPECLDPFNRKALRSSMGASYALRLLRGGPESLSRWSEGGVEVVAAALEEGAMGVDEWEGSGAGKVCVVLGNEHDGIAPDWRRQCARAVMIPVSGDVDSLNVAVAGSIIMREMSRRALPSRS